MPSFRSLILAIALLPLAATAATWQWRDASGQMVYSDQPPPPDVRPSQIIRGPAPVKVGTTPAAGGAATAGQSGQTAQAGQNAQNAPSAAAGGQAAASSQRSTAQTASSNEKDGDDRFQSWADREQAFRKRMAERQEAERKQKEEQEQATRLARACDDARSSLRTLESGMRIVTLDAAGEQVTMDDAERARRIESGRRNVSQHCGAG